MIVDEWLLDLVYKMGGLGIFLYVLITTVIAGVLATSIGLERQLHGESAGIRTHALLAIGCSLLMTLSIWAIRIADGQIIIPNFSTDTSGVTALEASYDTSRIGAAVVTGVGFLGAGVITKHKFSTKGLATAATLWISAAIGLACGAGFVLEAAGVTAVTLLALLALDNLLNIIEWRSPAIIVKASEDVEIMKVINEFSDDNRLVLRQMTIIEEDKSTFTCKANYAYNVNRVSLEYVRVQLLKVEGIKSITIDMKSKRKSNITRN